MSDRIGKLLVVRGLISLEDLQKAVEEHKLKGSRLELVLVRFGYINQDDLLAFLCNHYMVPFFRLWQFDILLDVIELIPSDLARKHLLIPIHRVRHRLVLAMVDPSDIDAIYDIWRLTSLNIEAFGALETEITNAIKKYYREEGDIAGNETAVSNPADKNEDASLSI
jgi:type IV pilus assembly protein PilB